MSEIHFEGIVFEYEPIFIPDFEIEDEDDD